MDGLNIKQRWLLTTGGWVHVRVAASDEATWQRFLTNQTQAWGDPQARVSGTARFQLVEGGPQIAISAASIIGIQETDG